MFMNETVAAAGRPADGAQYTETQAQLVAMYEPALSTDSEILFMRSE